MRKNAKPKQRPEWTPNQLLNRAYSVEEFQEAVDLGANPGALSNNGDNVLSSPWLTPETSELLIRAGAEPDLIESSGIPALFRQTNPAVIRAFSEHGADMDIRDRMDGGNYLHYLAQNGENLVETAQAAIKLGTNPNGLDRDGNTPMHMLLPGSAELGFSLADGGANLRATNAHKVEAWQKWLALTPRQDGRREATLLRILQDVNPNTRVFPPQDWTPAYTQPAPAWTFAEQPSEAQIFIDHPDTILNFAELNHVADAEVAEIYRAEITRRMADEMKRETEKRTHAARREGLPIHGIPGPNPGGSPNVRKNRQLPTADVPDGGKPGPVRTAKKSGERKDSGQGPRDQPNTPPTTPPEIDIPGGPDPYTLEWKIQRGADPNRIEEDTGRSLVFFYLNPPCLKTLLKYGADAAHRDTSGRTALFYVNRPDAAQMLIQHGCSVNAQDKTGRTALHSAVRGSADIYMEPVILALLKNGANPNIRDSQRRTVAHMHVELSMDALEAMHARGMDLNLQNQAGIAAWVAQMDMHEPKTSRKHADPERLRWFLEHGADPNVPTGEDRAPAWAYANTLRHAKIYLDHPDLRISEEWLHCSPNPKVRELYARHLETNRKAIPGNPTENRKTENPDHGPHAREPFPEPEPGVTTTKTPRRT